MTLDTHIEPAASCYFDGASASRNPTHVGSIEARSVPVQYQVGQNIAFMQNALLPDASRSNVDQNVGDKTQPSMATSNPAMGATATEAAITDVSDDQAPESSGQQAVRPSVQFPTGFPGFSGLPTLPGAPGMTGVFPSFMFPGPAAFMFNNQYWQAYMAQWQQQQQQQSQGQQQKAGTMASPFPAGFPGVLPMAMPDATRSASDSRISKDQRRKDTSKLTDTSSKGRQGRGRKPSRLSDDAGGDDQQRANMQQQHTDMQAAQHSHQQQLEQHVQQQHQEAGQGTGAGGDRQEEDWQAADNLMGLAAVASLFADTAPAHAGDADSEGTAGGSRGSGRGSPRAGRRQGKGSGPSPPGSKTSQRGGKRGRTGGAHPGAATAAAVGASAEAKANSTSQKRANSN